MEAMMFLMQWELLVNSCSC